MQRIIVLCSTKNCEYYNTNIVGIVHTYSLPYGGIIGYEPAGLTVHPPPRMIEGGFIFFVWVSSATKMFSSKKKWIL